jgi:dolichyl-phosphate beta-glucosyltransferase
MDGPLQTSGKDASMRHSLSVVIPTYNETHRLPQTLREIYSYLRPRCRNFEVVVVDDNSPDGTAALVERLAAEYPGLRVLVQPRRLGKGAAVRRGCLDARCEYVLFMDADHATPIEELDDMVPALDKLGSGAVAGVRTYQEDERRWRRIVGLAAQLLAHLIVFRKAVCDSQCGFKLFSRDVVQRVFPYCRVNGGMIDVELFSLLHAMGVPCRYQAVHWVNKEGSRIRVWRCVLFDPLNMAIIRLRHAWGVYGRAVLQERQPWNPKQLRHAPSVPGPAAAQERLPWNPKPSAAPLPTARGKYAA